ncbi:type II toxin-antitoxin system VapC family toxin [Nonomuraea sp. NPDC046570]|uniref:type II toxin-antitoxin system VapC family toxin n=1 Tax=Nonomuraea sp. NPDC046570 TaxID=3155255 RepID=UPI0033DE8396
MDTNILILAEWLDPDELPDSPAICVITLAELAVGPLVARDPQEQASRQLVLSRAEAEFEPIPFDVAAARTYARVHTAIKEAGRNPRRDTADLLIASVAIAHQLPLYTVNPDDFKGLDGLLRIEPVTHPEARAGH